MRGNLKSQSRATIGELRISAQNDWLVGMADYCTVSYQLPRPDNDDAGARQLLRIDSASYKALFELSIYGGI